jgi:hypothetical protein
MCAVQQVVEHKEKIKGNGGGCTGKADKIRGSHAPLDNTQSSSTLVAACVVTMSSCMPAADDYQKKKPERG